MFPFVFGVTGGDSAHKSCVLNFQATVLLSYINKTSFYLTQLILYIAALIKSGVQTFAARQAGLNSTPIY